MKLFGKPLDQPLNGGGGEPPRRRAWQSPANADKPAPAAQTERIGKSDEGGTEPLKSATSRFASGLKNTAKTGAPAPVARVVPSAAKITGPSPPARAESKEPGSRSPVPTGGFRRPPPLRGPALVSRWERILFFTLLASAVAMSVFLVRYRERVDAHFQARAMAVPLAGAAAQASAGPLMLSLANDSTGALTERSLPYPVPQDPGTRARVALEKLLSEYTAPGSLHPLKSLAPGVETVNQVFLLPAPGRRGTLAVVDLSSGFARLHPSGIEVETLTLLSMIATLHANLPAVTEVRFLVDGEPRTTLAGHADLDRAYLAGAAPMTPSEAFTTAGAAPK